MLGVGLAALLFGFAAVAVASPEIAYVAYTDGFWQVWTMNADGKEQRQVTRSTSDKIKASWFPDGKSLLVCLTPGLVERVDLQSGTETLIAMNKPVILDAVLAPDGTHVAFSYGVTGSRDGNDIFMTRADGSEPVQLTHMPALQHEPAWSPDSKALYFLSGSGGQSHDIWRLQLTDKKLEQLTVGSLYHFDIAVSRSGDVAYSSNASGNYEIWNRESDGKAKQLTNDPALDARPTFSPDSKQIIFASSRGGVTNLWRMTRQGQDLVQLTHHPKGASSPVWRVTGTVTP